MKKAKNHKKKLLIILGSSGAILFITLLILLKIYDSVSPKIEESEDNTMIKINLNIDGTNYTATLEDNETTKELIKKFPLEIEMSELNGNEKYYYFDNSFPSNPSQVGKINSGNLMLYGDDCLVLFYDTFNTQYSYTKIGKIDNPTSLKNNVGKNSIIVSFSK